MLFILTALRRWDSDRITPRTPAASYTSQDQDRAEAEADSSAYGARRWCARISP